MDISDFDCPQYINFQRILNGSTATSESQILDDSLEAPDCEAEERTYGAVSPGLEQNLPSAEVSNRSNKSQKENFPVNRPKRMAVKTVAPAKGTIPKPFHFETDRRIKSKPVEDVKPLKAQQNVASHATRSRVTKVKPFNLTEAKKRKREDEYVPLAEQAAKYLQKTPDRYRSQKEFQPQEHWEPAPLVAKTPNLRAVKRQRKVEALSREELEAIEVAEMQAYQFHARPVDPKIYTGPPIKLPLKTRVTPKTLRLKVEDKEKQKQKRRSPSAEKKYEFRARPVPKAILEGTVGLKEKQVRPATNAVSPSFQVNNRLEKRKVFEQEKEKKAREEQEAAAKKQARKAAHSQSACEPFVKKLTRPEPFSFDKADEIRYTKKMQKIQEELEEESKPFVFRAQLMPSATPSALPVVEKKPVTEPQPFNLHENNRSSGYSSFMSNESQVSFKAQPADVLKKEPFKPIHPPKEPLDVQEFNLNTDRRASERLQLRILKEKEEREREEELLLRRAREEEQERKELRKLRSEIVHRAQPIRQYKPVEIKPSSMPLTEPQTPNFAVEKRLRSKRCS